MRSVPHFRHAALPLFGALALAAAPAGAARDEFPRFLEELAGEAREQGISQATIDAALLGVEPVERVIELDRSQPRKPADFCGYMEKRLTPTRIARGRRVLQEQRELLRDINEEYAVPARYVVALWGLETNFGDYMGDYPVVASLATLAWDPRRSDLFRRQVVAALQILDEGHRPAEGFHGSWAGATGHVQLMPTTFLGYAVDHDGDGRKNVWSSIPDALASAANYLRASGWRAGETWGRQVQLPDDLDRAKLRRSAPVTQWQERGVRSLGGGDLPVASLHGSVVLPLQKIDPAFLVYRNYRTFKAWNNSTFFAISVGTLADAIDGRGGLRACGL